MTMPTCYDLLITCQTDDWPYEISFEIVDLNQFVVSHEDMSSDASTSRQVINREFYYPCIGFDFEFRAMDSYGDGL